MTATPKTMAAVTRLLEEYADLDGRIALVEEDRSADIAAANQHADVAAAPMVKRRDEIAGILETWWPHAVANDVSKGKKSMQLGGCLLGTRKGRPSVAHDFESDDKAIAAIPSRIIKQCTRIRYSLDRAGIAKALQLDGAAARILTALGFRLDQPERFFVERVQQDRTIGS
jgi:hypothetical protein